MSDSQYSFSLTTFSPSGKLLQLEYALNAVASGKPALGLKATNGVVVITEKKASTPLMDVSRMHKVAPVAENIGMVFAGMVPDYRVVLKAARKSAIGYQQIWNEPMPTSQLVRETAMTMQEYTQSGGVRPFGISVLVAGWCPTAGPQLFQVDPSGAYFGWKAAAIGRNSTNAKNFLAKRLRDDMDLDDAMHAALLTIKEGFEGDLKANNIEVGVADEKGFRLLSESQVDDLLRELE